MSLIVCLIHFVFLSFRLMKAKWTGMDDERKIDLLFFCVFFIEQQSISAEKPPSWQPQYVPVILLYPPHRIDRMTVISWILDKKSSSGCNDETR